MERRRFLKTIGVGSAVVTAVPVFGYSLTSLNGIAVSLILNECHFLKIERSEAEKFVDDFYISYFKNAAQTAVLSYKLRLKSYYFLKFDSSDSELVKELVHNFLFSTDFFVNRMDESKPVKYTGLHNPFTTPCYNPFSFLYYPPEKLT